MHTTPNTTLKHQLLAYVILHRNLAEPNQYRTTEMIINKLFGPTPTAYGAETLTISVTLVRNYWRIECVPSIPMRNVLASDKQLQVYGWVLQLILHTSFCTVIRTSRESSAADIMHVLIVGAGLGGLTLAQNLRKRGISYEIFERDANKDSRFQGWAIALHT
jgi:hypothetical protein